MLHEHPIRRSKKSDGGFTLLEVVIAMACFSVVSLAIFRMTGTTWQAVDFAKSSTEASIMAAEHLEALFSEKFASSQAAGTSARLTNGDHTFTSNGYTVDYTVSDDAVLPDSKFIRMNVSYTRGGAVRTITYNYLVPMRK